MRSRNPSHWLALSLVVIAAMLLTSCAAPTPQVVEKVVTQVVVQKQEVPVEVTKVVQQQVTSVVQQEVTKVVEKVITATPPPGGPQVGGNFVIATTAAVDSLNPIAAVSGLWPLQFVGGTLVSKDPSTGKIVPYLAQSWTVSDDGLEYTFKLREDVKFHDGSPMTADDYAWSIQQMLDPANKSYCGSVVYQGVKSAEAVDKSTLKITLASPNFYFLNTMSGAGCGEPLSKAYAEKAGDNLAKQPVGVGPFKVTSWEPGVKVVLERNPDFAWGPAYTHGGPAYIDKIEYRTVLDYATLLAAVESGEAHWSYINNTDSLRIAQTGLSKIQQVILQGNIHTLMANADRKPLDDVRVRKALAMAIDRDILMKVVETGVAAAFPGALTSSTPGYCAEADALGYTYDLAKAKELMAEAGYKPGADGILQKDGKPLELNLTFFSWKEKMATVLQEQLKALGVKVKMNTGESGALVGQITNGEQDLAPLGWEGTAWVLFMNYDSKMAGFANASRVNDPELDKLLETMMNTTDAATNAKAACDAQKRIMENAYGINLYASIMSAAATNQVEGIRLPAGSQLDLFDAYFK